MRDKSTELYKKGAIQGHTAMTSFGKHIKLPKFMALREPYQYEELKARAEQAAVVDADSNSLDKHIFHGDGVDVAGGYKTAFELGLASELSAQASRIKDLGRRDIVAARAEQLDFEEQAISITKRLDLVKFKIESTNAAIIQEAAVLEGRQPGEGGVLRPGTKMDHNGFQGMWSAYRHLVVYVFVSIIDAGVLWKSLEFLFDGNGVEAILFSLPAIGVQVVFPHFIGTKLNMLLHGTEKKARELSFLIVLIAAWGAFVYSISYIRIMHLGEQMASAPLGDANFDQKLQLLQIFTPIVLVGLGFWLILEVVKHNQHEVSFIKLNRLRVKLLRNQLGLEGGLAKLTLRVKHQSAAVEGLEASVRDHVSVVENVFPEASRQIYRRALVNRIGDPDFTTEATK